MAILNHLHRPPVSRVKFYPRRRSTLPILSEIGSSVPHSEPFGFNAKYSLKKEPLGLN